jgi:hypothetical protein
MSWRALGIRKGFPPMTEVASGTETDMAKKELPCLANPGFGNEAARFHRFRVVVQVVDDEIWDILRNGRQHLGFREKDENGCYYWVQ